MAKITLKNITLLKTVFGVYLLVLLGFTIFFYSGATVSSGWLFIGILFLSFFGVLGFAIGLITPLFIGNRRTLFVVELVILICFVLWFLYVLR